MEFLFLWLMPAFTAAGLSILLAMGWDTGEWRHSATFINIDQCEMVKKEGQVCVPIDDDQAGLFEKRKPIEERIMPD